METQSAPKWNPQVRGKPSVKAPVKVSKKLIEIADKSDAKPSVKALAARKSVVPAEVHKAYPRIPDKKGKVHVCNGDGIAKSLIAKDINEIYALVAKKCGVSEKELREKYIALNLGMQRMNLGNRLRHAMNK